MKRTLKIMIAVGALAAFALPSSAGAAESCLYQSEQASAKNLINLERSLLCLTNLHRLDNGLSPLERDTRLFSAARAHSIDMATRHFFAHDTPEGLTAQQRATAAGYPGGAGEIIASSGNGTALSLVQQWLESPPHNTEMLRSFYKAAGAGIDPRFYTGSAGITGTQMFGVSDADTGDDGLDLYASSNKCAKAKLALIAAKRKGGKEQRKRVRSRVNRLCKDPPGSKKGD